MIEATISKSDKALYNDLMEEINQFYNANNVVEPNNPGVTSDGSVEPTNPGVISEAMTSC